MDLVEARATHPHRHPWELARADAILALIRPTVPRPRYADIGAGDLYVAERLARLPNGGVVAVDSSFPGTGASPSGIRLCADVAALQDGSVDVALLMDVLEHVEDEAGFLGRVVRCLRPGTGTMVVTVPAHGFLWSSHDVFLRHCRRYDRPMLERVLSASGLRVQRSFYFFAVPFLVRALQVAAGRLGTRSRPDEGVGAWPYPATHPITRGLRAVLACDFRTNHRLAAAGLPTLGLSICAICSRPSA